MAAYATRRDLYRYGLPRGALASGARLVASVSATSDTFELDEHGFETDDEIFVRPAEGEDLPSPLVDGTTYYAIRVSGARFKLSATEGGSAIDLTTSGGQFMVGTPLPFDDVLEEFSRFVDPYIPAHLVPLQAPYPVVVIATVARLASRELQRIAGISSESMAEAKADAEKQLQNWAKGVPLRDSRATASANRAVVSTLSSASDPRGWGSGELP